MSYQKSIIVYWLPVITYAVLIFIQSSFPSSDSLPAIPYLDKWLHGAGYALLAILFYRAYNTLKIKDKLFLVMLISIFSSTLYGISDEIHQYYVPQRYAELGDVLADFVGSVAGVFAYRSFNQLFLD